MKLTEKQREEMLAAAKPLMKWLNENCHPHCEAKVDQNLVELTEGVAAHRTDEFIKGCEQDAQERAKAAEAAKPGLPKIPEGFRELSQGDKILRSDSIYVGSAWVRRDSHAGRTKSWAIGEAYNCYTDGLPAYPGFHHRTIRRKTG